MFATGYLSSVWTFLGALFFELWAVISALIVRFVESLHETRQRQAAEIIRRNRDLICDPGSNTHKDCNVQKNVGNDLVSCRGTHIK